MTPEEASQLNVGDLLMVEPTGTEDNWGVRVLKPYIVKFNNFDGDGQLYVKNICERPINVVNEGFGSNRAQYYIRCKFATRL